MSKYELGTNPGSSNIFKKFQYEAKVDEICWELCKLNYLERDNPLLPDDCVYMCFRIFCMLGEMVENDKGMPEVVMAATEVENAAFRCVPCIQKFLII